MKEHRKRGGVPDVRRVAYSYGAVETEGEQAAIRALAHKHHFPAKFDFPNRLSDALFWWRFNLAVGHGPSSTERKRYFRELERAARQFAGVAAHAGGYERSLIFCLLAPGLQLSERNDWEPAKPREPMALNTTPDDSQWLDVVDSFQRLAEASVFAIAKVGRSRTGPRGRESELTLLRELWCIYRKGFGKAAMRITWNDAESRFSGKFFDLADDVLREFCGVQLENLPLGRLIKKAQKTARRSK
jgi:hypothetical protein